MDDWCTKTCATKTSSGVPIADTTYHMLSRHMHESDDIEVDFPLYPDPQNMFSSNPFSIGPYTYPRIQEASSQTFRSSSMYAEAPPYMETPELRASSNYSTASGPSASSASMGSPYSIHGYAVPVPEWAPQGLGLNPSIVGYDNFDASSDYTFHPSGMDDFALEFNAVKPNGFVGEYHSIPNSLILFYWYILDWI